MGRLQKRIKQHVKANGFGHKYADDAWNAMKLGFEQIVDEIRKDFPISELSEKIHGDFLHGGNASRVELEIRKWFEKWL